MSKAQTGSRRAKLPKDLWTDDRGVTLVEYGIALVLATTVGTATLILLGDQISAKIMAANAWLGG